MYAARYYNSRRQMKSNLSVPLSVTSVGETRAKVKIGDSGLYEQFPDDRLQIGDLVYARRSELPIVSINEFKYLGPVDQKAAVKMNYRGARQVRLDTFVRDSVLSLQGQIRELLQARNVPLAGIQNAKAGTRIGVNRTSGSIENYGSFLPPDARVTHVIEANVVLVKENMCEIAFGVRDPESNQYTTQFKVPLPIGKR